MTWRGDVSMVVEVFFFEDSESSCMEELQLYHKTAS